MAKPTFDSAGDELFTILYHEPATARESKSYYERIAAASGVHIRWVPYDAVVLPEDFVKGDPNPAQLLVQGLADALLVNGHEPPQQLKSADISVIISGRGERRLIALFRPGFKKQISLSKVPTPLKLTADLEWQAEMAAVFLKKALPKNDSGCAFELHSNFLAPDLHLQRLWNEEMDIAILPWAALQSLEETLNQFDFMVLPLFECPPNIYQGTTALAIKTRDLAVEHNAFIDAVRFEALKNFRFNTAKPQSSGSDRKAELRYQKEISCLERFSGTVEGVVHIELPLCSFTYAAGMRDGKLITAYDMDVEFPVGKRVFSTTDFMKAFFRYEDHIDETFSPAPLYFIASHKAVNDRDIIECLGSGRVWAAGTRTWFELAKMGIWIEGCADGLGLESLSELWQDYLQIEKNDVLIVTNAESAKHWRADGWRAAGTYMLVPEVSEQIVEGLKSAEVVFWTSYQQYEACRAWLPPGLIHASPAGKTAVLLKRDGIKDLIVFPSIKAYNWAREQSAPKQ